MTGINKDWRNDIYAVFKDLNITMVSHVPDAGHTPLINLCEKDNEIDVVTLTTEQDGVGLSCGAYAGGRKSALLMQSSGVGNCINALALPNICRIPFLTIVSKVPFQKASSLSIGSFLIPRSCTSLPIGL